MWFGPDGQANTKVTGRFLYMETSKVLQRDVHYSVHGQKTSSRRYPPIDLLECIRPLGFMPRENEVVVNAIRRFEIPHFPFALDTVPFSKIGDHAVTKGLYLVI